MQLSFDAFRLDRPNDCGANFLDVFGETTDVPSRLKNFCGSIAEPVGTKTNTLFIRLYLELKAINSNFKALITAIRERGSTDKRKSFTKKNNRKNITMIKKFVENYLFQYQSKNTESI